jgi:hypothetical protein
MAPNMPIAILTLDKPDSDRDIGGIACLLFDKENKEGGKCDEIMFFPRKFVCTAKRISNNFN